MPKPKLKCDKEFMMLKQPLPEDAYTSLEEDIFDNGCTSPLLVWENTIIDGYKRYEICHTWQFDYQTKQIDFSCREEALLYICIDQLNRSDLSKEAICYLIGKRFEIEKTLNTQKAANLLYEEQTAQKIHSVGRHTNFSFQTAIELGKEYHISHNTVYKYGIYARHIDIIWDKEPEIVRKIFSGKLKISHENVIELARLPKGNIRTLNEHLSKSGIEHIGYSDMRHELQWKRISAATNPAQRREKPPTPDFEIKKQPKYDPDAEISSLSLTIPSWVGTIKRVCDNTNFPEISQTAQDKLLRQLHLLYEAVQPLLDQLREENHNG